MVLKGISNSAVQPLSSILVRTIQMPSHSVAASRFSVILPSTSAPAALVAK